MNSRLSTLLLALLLVLSHLALCDKMSIKRELDVTKLNDNSFEMRAYSNTGDKQREYIKFKFDTSGFPRFRMDYVNKNKTAFDGFTYRVGFRKLVELAYNGSPYNGSQTVLSEYKLEGGSKWNDLVYNNLLDSTTNTSYHQLSVSTKDKVVSLTITVASSAAVINKRTLAPNALKIDVVIANYPYANPNSSCLALLTRVESAYEAAQSEYTNNGKTEHTVVVGRLGFAGFENYANTTEFGIVDVKKSGFLKSNTTTDSGDDDKRTGEAAKDVAFTFMATNSAYIDWDPIFGVGDPATQADPTLTGTSAAAATTYSCSVVVVAAVALVMMIMGA